MTLKPCTCPPDVSAPQPSGVGQVVCVECGGQAEKASSPEPKSVILTPEVEKFARGLIGQQQQIILKSRRIIDDIKTQFGLKE